MLLGHRGTGGVRRTLGYEKCLSRVNALWETDIFGLQSYRLAIKIQTLAYDCNYINKVSSMFRKGSYFNSVMNFDVVYGSMMVEKEFARDVVKDGKYKFDYKVRKFLP